ncbi:hypothetical protein BDQ17DRAFT_1428635 [Cyathus striatus]|nr:hypothetical protein BDQ17DRAFT_1428635 [Cyathus striatus]
MDIWKAANLRMADSGGGSTITVSDSEKEDVDENNATSSEKKHKDNNGKVVIIRKGMDSFVDRALTKQEQDKANTHLIKWFIHRNIPFSQADNPFFKKWMAMI